MEQDPLAGARLRRLLPQLATRMRGPVVLLRFQEDLDPADIAPMLEMSVNTVKSHCAPLAGVAARATGWRQRWILNASLRDSLAARDPDGFRRERDGADHRRVRYRRRPRSSAASHGAYPRRWLRTVFAAAFGLHWYFGAAARRRMPRDQLLLALQITSFRTQPGAAQARAHRDTGEWNMRTRNSTRSAMCCWCSRGADAAAHGRGARRPSGEAAGFLGPRGQGERIRRTSTWTSSMLRNARLSFMTGPRSRTRSWPSSWKGWRVSAVKVFSFAEAGAVFHRVTSRRVVASGPERRAGRS